MDDTFTIQGLPTSAREWELMWDVTAMLAIELLEEIKLGCKAESHDRALNDLRAMRTALHSRWRNQG